MHSDGSSCKESNMSMKHFFKDVSEAFSQLWVLLCSGSDVKSTRLHAYKAAVFLTFKRVILLVPWRNRGPQNNVILNFDFPLPSIKIEQVKLNKMSLSPLCTGHKPTAVHLVKTSLSSELGHSTPSYNTINMQNSFPFLNSKKGQRLLLSCNKTNKQEKQISTWSLM